MLALVEFRVLDHNAVGLGVSLARLMERAGQVVAEQVTARGAEPGRAVLFCGPGNNGGDGLVAARHLQAAGWQVRVVLAGAEGPAGLKTELTRQVWERLPQGVERCHWAEGPLPEKAADWLRVATVAVDALLGSGLKGRLREPFPAAVEALNGSGLPVVSVDVPTGLGAEPMVRPAVTVTFAESKEGMTPENSGQIVEVDIGFPREARTRCGPGEAQLWQPPLAEGHKGDNGVVAVVGGGPYTGAPVLAGLAAYRAGADLVYLLCPERAATAAAAYAPEFIVQPLEGPWLSLDHLETIQLFCRKADAVVLGPGLGRAPETQEAVRELVVGLDQPLVVDADGLYVVAAAEGLLESRGRRLTAKTEGQSPQDLTILTPHRGELHRLGSEHRSEPLLEYARRVQATVLAKGRVDLITDGEHLKENHTGNPRLAVGGTGDVLAGAVAALRARGLSGYQAARLGAYLVGSAGDLALQQQGWGYLPSEVADLLPKALELALKV